MKGVTRDTQMAHQSERARRKSIYQWTKEVKFWNEIKKQWKKWRKLQGKTPRKSHIAIERSSWLLWTSKVQLLCIFFRCASTASNIYTYYSWPLQLAPHAFTRTFVWWVHCKQTASKRRRTERKKQQQQQHNYFRRIYFVSWSERRIRASNLLLLG